MPGDRRARHDLDCARSGGGAGRWPGCGAGAERTVSARRRAFQYGAHARRSQLHGPAWHVDHHRWHADREPQLLGLQPVHRPARAGRQPAHGAQGLAVRGVPQAADAGDRGLARHCGLRARQVRHAWRRDATRWRTQSGPGLSYPAGPAAGRAQGPGVRRPRCGSRRVAGRQGQQRRDDLHARRLQQARQPRGQRAAHGLDRPDLGGGGNGHRRAARTLAGDRQERRLPVHPGIHRLRLARHPGDVFAGLLLAQDHRCGGHVRDDWRAGVFGVSQVSAAGDGLGVSGADWVCGQ